MTAAVTAGVVLAAAPARADDHKGHAGGDAPKPSPLSPALVRLQRETAQCAAAGRYCLARCTDHLAAGMKDMADCQKAVMNMLAVVEAMATTAGYRNADPANLKALAKVCAAFCRACAEACAPHAKHHEECKACGEACKACAAACDGFAG